MTIAKAPLWGQKQVTKGLTFILVGAVIFFSAAGNRAVRAATYYVDGENGNDVLGDGSSDAPWRTFDKAVSQARLVRPSTVYFRTAYYGMVDVDYLPTACGDVAGVDYEAGWNNAITFAAEPGQTPTCGQIIIRQAFDRYFIFDGFRIEDRTNDLSVPGEPYLVQVRGARQVKLLNLTVRGQEGAYCSRSGVTAAGIEVSCAGGTDPVINGVLIEGCDISHVEVGIKCKAIQSGGETFGWGNVIRGNYIHDVYGTGVSLALADNTSELVIENNVMANSNPLIQWMQLKGTVQQAFSDGEKVSQSSSGAAGTVYASGSDWLNIFVTSPVLFETGGSITADDGTGAMNEPAEIIKKDYTHASGVSIRCRNVTVRGNVFRAFGTTSGIMTYPPYAGSHPQQNGYTNVVVENNLFYDMGAVYAVRLENLGSNIRFNNNTVIGYHIGTGISRYGTQVRLLPLEGLASEKRHDIAFYNNLVVGGVSLSYGDMHLTGFSEDYNIFWSCSNPETGWWLPAGLGNLQGSHTFIATADTSQPSTFEYNFFVNCDYSRGSDFVRYTDGGPNGQVLDYRLVNTAQAVDFCSLANGPAADTNGVSRVDIAGFGNDGDNYADAGCYEYVLADSGNHIPVLAEIGNMAVSEGGSLTFTVNATDADGDTLTFSAQGLPDGASLTGQSFSWAPGYDQAGPYQVTFTVSDGKVLDSETITINVSNVNRPPVLWEIGDKAAGEGSLLTFSVVASDPDGDNITYSAQNLPTGATFANRTFNWTPGYDRAGAYQVTFVVSDGQAQDSETITITVANANRAPVMDRIGGKSVDENSSLSFSVNATDPDGETLQYSVGALPPGASFVARQFAWTPGYDQAGGYQVTFTVSDGQAQDSETVSIIVENVNRPPVLETIGAKSVDENKLLTFTVSASDPDPDTIQYSATGLPSGATLTGQNFSWTPTHSQADKTYSVTFVASDGHLQDSQAVTITVTSLDTSPPVLINRSPAPDSIQAPLNTLTILHLVDPGKGVDADTVTIKLDGNLVYEGDTPQYTSLWGDCRRTGDKADYTFAFQSKQMFDFDQTVTVTVGAADLEGNVMP
ncbi:MAG: tandem-95 repeat protein [Phycisphaerales bacterium]|nr:MAG: tandem-95 repeat protein [Phycisphaerales bacterium]